MNCKSCGASIVPGEKFCRGCGTPVQEESNNIVPPTVTNFGGVQTPVQPTMDQLMSQPTQPTPSPVAPAPTFGAQPTMNQPTMNQPVMSQSVMSQPTINNQLGAQPATQQPIMGQPTMKEPKNNNKLIIIIVAVIALAAIIICAVFFMKDDKETPKDDPKNTPPVEEVATTVKVKNDGFVFSIPEDYTYEISGGSLVVTDEYNWAFQLEVLDGRYDTIKANRMNIKTNFAKAGYVATNPELKTVNGVEWITTEITMGGKTHVIAYSKASGTKVYGVEIITVKGTADYDVLNKVTGITKTAVYEGTSQSISTGGFVGLEAAIK